MNTNPTNISNHPNPVAKARVERAIGNGELTRLERICLAGAGVMCLAFIFAVIMGAKS